MAKLNIYHRRDGRWEGRISRGKKENGKRKYQYVIARTRDAVVERMEDICRNERQKDNVLKQYLYCSRNGTAVFSIGSRNLPLQTIQ